MMRALVVAENDVTAARIRTVLVDHGHDCPRSQVVSIDQARRTLNSESAALDVVFVAADARLQSCLTDLQQVHHAHRDSKIIAVSRGSDPNRILNAIRAGAHDYWDEGGDLGRQLTDLVNRIDKERLSRHRKGKVIAIASAAGGSGCSFLAANLAAVLSAECGGCGLVDLKLRGGDLASLLNLTPKHSIADLSQRDRLEAAMVQQTLLPHSSGIQLLASPRMFEPGIALSSHALDDILREMRGTCNFTLVDMEDLFHREQMHLLVNCDALIMVVRMDFVSLVRTYKSILFLEREGVPRQKFRVVVNRYNAPGCLPRYKARAALGMRVTTFLPDDVRAVNTSLNAGEPAVLQSPSSRISRAITKLARKLNATL